MTRSADKGVLQRLRRLVRRENGSTAIEFAICGPIIIVLMIYVFDQAMALYARNAFSFAVSKAARTIYLDNGRTLSELESSLEDELARVGENPQTKVVKETIGGVDYWRLTATATYRYKAPGMGGLAITLSGEGRAPVLDYRRPTAGT